jgi:hypothetical protein
MAPKSASVKNEQQHEAAGRKGGKATAEKS